MRGLPAPVEAVTHGGITIDLLRTLLGDDSLPPGVMDAGIPPCAVTPIAGMHAVMIASVTHLM
jgi:hypothetical protein